MNLIYYEFNELYIIIITILIIFFLYNKISINNEHLLLKSYDIPYIPNNIQLKDKDNKIIKHLKFRFIYTCPKKIFDNLIKISKNMNHKVNNIKKLFLYLKMKKKCICFYLINNETLNISKYYKKYIKCYPYKLYDTYVMGDTRIFNQITDILICQGYDRDKYGINCISTTFLNEICSNKIEYIKYFLKHNLMIGTYIKKYNSIPENNKYINKYVKAPYSSRAICASYEEIKNKCYLNEGIIVQEKNNILNKYEIKCYCLNGDIEMIIIRLDGINVNICIPKDYNNINDELKNLIEVNKEELKQVCKKAFYCINSLIGMRIKKLKIDENEVKKIFYDLEKTFDIDKEKKKKIKYILTGLVNYEKIKLINKINKNYNKKYNYKILIKNIIDYPDPIELKKQFKIYDKFMRIDMAFPDYNKYNSVTVTEIEPFASGIYNYSTIGECMVDDKLNKFDNIIKYNLYKIISSEKENIF